MDTTLIMFSGLAGTGKSTLANAVARELKIPVISFDYFIDHALPRHVMTDPGHWTNQDVFETMNKLAEQQLSLGLSVILDAVYFTKEGREAVHAVAEKCQTRFCVIHTLCSDKDIWQERVVRRAENSSFTETPAHWDSIMAEMKAFHPWEHAEALFVDSILPIEINVQKIKSVLVQSQAVD